VIRLPGFVAHHVFAVGVVGAKCQLFADLPSFRRFQLDQQRVWDGEYAVGVFRFGVVLLDGLAVDADLGGANG
jgi:hypothetical protein